MIRRFYKQSLVFLLVASFIVPSGLFVRPEKTEAGASCIAAYLTSLVKNGTPATAAATVSGTAITAAVTANTTAGASIPAAVAGSAVGFPAGWTGGGILLGILGAIGISSNALQAASLTTQTSANASVVQSTGAQESLSFDSCILKPIAIKMAKVMARNISNSIVNWINTGFNGKPSFVTDMNGLIKDTTDKAIGDFIYGSDLKFLCQPFATQIRLQLALKYQQPFQEQIRCTLTDITNNLSTNGGQGWDNWLKITTQPQNNQYGAYLIAEAGLAQNIQHSLDLKNQDLAFGNGFQSWDVCTEYENTDVAANRFADYSTNKIAQLKETDEEIKANSSAKPKCLKSERKTPGTIVADGAKTVLGGWSNELGLATDIDQIIGALVNHFTEKMIAGAQGFLGLSSPGGYATKDLTYAKAVALANDTTNPDNAGLADTNAAANIGLASLSPTSQVETGTSLATGKTVTESSAGIGSSAWVTDGDTNTSAATDATSNPWIEVDLGAPQKISEIHIWGPTNKSPAESIGTFDVVVSNTSGGRDSTSDQTTLAAGAPNPTVVAVNKTARYIRVERFSNSYQCNVNPETGAAEACYKPLELAEIEVIAPTGTSTGQGALAGQAGIDAKSPIVTVGPSSDGTTIGYSRPFTFTVPIDSSSNTNVSLVEVRLYSGSNPVAFSSAFDAATIGVKQNSSLKNYSAGSAPGIDLANVVVGPSSYTSVVISGKTLPPSNTNTYKLVVTARDVSRAVLGTETINMVISGTAEQASANAPTDALPFGVLDSATCNTITGWALDGDTPADSINVHLYKEGVGISGFLLAAVTDVLRGDVNGNIGVTGKHGFSIPTPASLKDGVAHQIYMYAINSKSSGTGTNTLLKNSPITLTCPIPVKTISFPTVQTPTTQTTPSVSVSLSVDSAALTIPKNGSAAPVLTSTATVTGPVSLSKHGLEMSFNGGIYTNVGAWNSLTANSPEKTDSSFSSLNLTQGGTYDFRAYASIDGGKTYSYSDIKRVTATKAN